MVKFWQCSTCREATEDCDLQCQLITGNDVIPENCVRDKYICDGKMWVDDEGNLLNPQPKSFPILTANWSEIEEDDILYVFSEKWHERRLNLNNNKVYYLAHPYANNPLLSQGFAENHTLYLLDIGYTVFSPILHTHYFHINMEKKYENINAKWIPPDYVNWDLSILEAMKKNLIMLISNTAFKNGKWLSPGCKKEFDWAIKNQVPCYVLEDFEEGNKISVEVKIK